jgi:hypothetical protein
LLLFFFFFSHPLEGIPPKIPRLRLLGRKADTENRRTQVFFSFFYNARAGAPSVGLNGKG